MEFKLSIVAALFMIIGIQTHFVSSVLRGKATDMELFIEKHGDCPTNDMVSSFLDEVCETECFLDMDCNGVEKCCQNGCGGTHCQLPNQFVDQCEEYPCYDQGTVCEVLGDQPTCVCQTNCTDDSEKVCADDGHVYISRCWMDVAACEQGISINETTCEETPEPPTDDGSPSMLLGDTVLTADEYQDVRFFCDAASDSPVWYTWSVMSPRVHFTVIMPGKAVGNIGVSLDGKVLTITSVRQEDAGGYICMATSRLGGSTVSHELIVNAQESPTTQSQTTLELRDQELVTEITTTPLPMEMAPPNEACVEILHRGHCFRQEVKWFYNMQSQRCEPFVYGGCGGNSNRFATYEQCSRACPNLPVDPCKHPIATGRCRAHLRRWSYQEDTGECVQFVYGGCGANGNNFRTRDECGYTCQDREAKKTNCECVRPKLKSSYCRSDFVIIGRIRQEISSTANGALLVIELQKLYKAPEAFPIRLGDHAYNITIVRDMSRTPRGCHCLSFTFDESFIFMGRIDEHGRAILDDNSYVSPSNGKRNARIRTSIRCNGNEENSLQGPRGGARRDGANVERRPQVVDDVVNVEREQDANRFIVKPLALPVYQRKTKKMLRTRIKRKQ